MANKARLEVVVTSTGVVSADKDLKALTATSKETEKQNERLAAAAEKAADRQARAAERVAEKATAQAEKAIQAAEREASRRETAASKRQQALDRQLARENEQWNDAVQKAIARDERRVRSAEKAAAREAEVWNNAIQRAKAGLDGVLPIRPSLQRIEAQLSKSATPAIGGQIAEGAQSGAMNALGIGFAAGGAAAIAAKAMETLAEGVKHVTSAVVENLVEDNNMIARLGGVTDSAEQADEAFSNLQKLTFGKLPSTLQEVSNAFVQLGNVGLSNSNAALKSYSNIAAQTGASLANVTSAVQSATLGNFKALREFGVKVKDEGDDLKITFRGQTETIRNNATEIESYLLSLGNVQFAGAVERQMDTIGGSIKKTDDAWERLVNAVGDSRLGAGIEAVVGSSVTIIDAMTAAVEALFGKIEKGQRELESAKLARAESDKLDATMRSWADPSASRAEIKALADELERNAQSSSDKALAHFARNEALIAKLRSLGEERVGDLTIDQAAKENERQYRRAAGETKAPDKPVEYHLRNPEQDAEDTYFAKVRENEYHELTAIRESLAAKEDAEHASFVKRREFLADYLGPDSEELWQRNEDLYAKHIDALAEKGAKEQLALQKRLRSIGVGPQFQLQSVDTKYAGQRFELDDALSENLSGKKGEVLRLQAEKTYKEKSIAIERARAEEIKKINTELAAQSLQNAELMFGGLAAVMKNAHGEQSKEYAVMFSVQRGFAIASAGLAMYQSMAEATKAGWPASIPLYIKAAAQGAQLIGQLTSQSYSGGYDSGGNIAGGSYGDVGERGNLELVSRPTRVNGPATVIGSRDTAALLGGGRSLRIVNAFEGGEAIRGFLGSTAGEQVIVNVIRRNSAVIQSLLQ